MRDMHDVHDAAAYQSNMLGIGFYDYARQFSRRRLPAIWVQSFRRRSSRTAHSLTAKLDGSDCIA